MLYKVTETKKNNYIELIKWIKCLNARSYEIVFQKPLKALRLCKCAYHLAQKCGCQEERAFSLLVTGYAHKGLSNNTKCIKNMLVAVQLFEHLGHLQGKMRALNLLGTNYFYFGAYELSLEYYNESLGLARGMADKAAEASILNNIGEIHRQLEQYREALIYYENAFVMSKDLNNLRNMAGILINMGYIYSYLNQNIKTLNIYRESLNYCRKIGDKIKIGEVLNCLGEAYEKLQKEQVALQYYLNSLRVLKKYGNMYYRINVLVRIGELLIKQNQQDRGLACLQEALSIGEKISAENELSKIHLSLSAYYEDKGNFAMALHHYKRFSLLEKKIRNEKLEEKLKLAATEFRIEQMKNEAEIFRLKNIELKRRNEEIKENARLLTLANQKMLKFQEQLKTANQRLKLLSTIDEVTGISNRRSFENTLKKEWNRCLREGKDLSLIIVDIDNFKRYNDSYGHLQGDKCLRKVAKVLESILKRSSDFMGRFGGEEFAAILSNTSYDDALKIADRMRRRIEKMKIVHEQSAIVSYITISLGLATTMPSYGEDHMNLVKAADQKLYQAKDQGRNRICSVRLR
ncbi:diguanylate cyclase [Desulfosporosinus sp. FKB]|uniref:tetratricopeptide repeat-containing diguanylate cyclase n=1 Tax=Desulfosporosinus sp. FKB TaxID=1969835 RepID=UPI001483A4E1|nr:diguanylate cyclase [Desulfosporosinus sp. FKB]